MNDIIVNPNQGIIDNLFEYDDFLNAFIQIDEASNNVSWFKADLLVAMSDKLGGESLKELSKELGENYSTLVSYVRVARAFPPIKRNIKVPFSAHFQASFADKFNTGTQQFVGEDRFSWIEKAVDENMSTRNLARAINEEKDVKKIDEPRSPATKIASRIRKALATITKMANEGNQNQLSLLMKIEELLESYG